MPSKFQFIDLFCGIGGFHMAMKQLGGECVFASEIDQKCCEVYQQNHGIYPAGDITQDDVKAIIPPHDLLCAGFPCFVAGTRVLTQDGYKCIEDVLISDRLSTHTGYFQKILNLQKKIYTGSDMCHIKLKYHPNEIICTPEHPFYVREKIRTWNNSDKRYDISYSKPMWVSAEQLTHNHCCGMPINIKILYLPFHANGK